ncbi:MAG: hypothetical protein IKC91_03595 [Clostridia bacterium]|nr:hypothetical protein [Clostridia bacterium]
MDTIEMQIGNFLNKCDDLLQAKFILAPSKISDLLRGLATVPALVSWLQRATASFDYLKAQELYLRPSPDGTQNKGVLLLPEAPAERVAFLFCLLVDIDNQVINFNQFLQTFFAEDGSYTQAFELFLAQVIVPFKNAVSEQFLPKSESTHTADAFSASNVHNGGKKSKKVIFNELSAVVHAEMTALSQGLLPDTDKAAGATLLNELYAAIKSAEENQIKALLIGYYYLVAYTKQSNENLLKMFALTEQL